jgi:hypothetical protein
MTYRDISRILECSLGAAHNHVVRARRQIAEVAAEELKQEIVERERAVIATHFKRRIDPDSAKVVQASDKILIAMFGLEAPAKSEVQLDARIETTAHDDIVGELAAQLAKRAVGSGGSKPDG